MHCLKGLGCLLFLVSALANANSEFPRDKYYTFLSKGFDIARYEACQDLIRQCPLNGIFPKLSCAVHALHNNKSCGQFKKLVQVLDVAPTQLYAKQVENFTILDMTFSADGQDDYYIISKGYLTNTNKDPRKFSTTLAKKFKNTEFFIVNWGEPHYKIHPDGSRTFAVILKVTDSCLACSIIGWANMEYNYTKEGLYLNTTLKKFKKTI